MDNQGKLIVIEGSDSSGKETQTKRIVKRLNALKCGFCEYMSFPRYNTPTGKLIKRYLAGEFGPPNDVDPKIASTFYANDRYAASRLMRDKLNVHYNIFCDRWVESNMAHQGGKIRDPRERAEFIKWLEDFEYGDYKLPRPDKVIFLYVPYQVGMELRKKRGGKPDGHESNVEHLMNTEQAYLELAKMHDWLKIDCAPDDNMRKEKDITDEIFENVTKLIGVESKLTD